MVITKAQLISLKSASEMCITLFDHVEASISQLINTPVNQMNPYHQCLLLQKAIE